MTQKIFTAEDWIRDIYFSNLKHLVYGQCKSPIWRQRPLVPFS